MYLLREHVQQGEILLPINVVLTVVLGFSHSRLCTMRANKYSLKKKNDSGFEFSSVGRVLAYQVQGIGLRPQLGWGRGQITP